VSYPFNSNWMSTTGIPGLKSGGKRELSVYGESYVIESNLFILLVVSCNPWDL